MRQEVGGRLSNLKISALNSFFFIFFVEIGFKFIEYK